jgi:hypothetical protein
LDEGSRQRDRSSGFSGKNPTQLGPIPKVLSHLHDGIEKFTGLIRVCRQFCGVRPAKEGLESLHPHLSAH